MTRSSIFTPGGILLLVLEQAAGYIRNFATDDAIKVKFAQESCILPLVNLFCVGAMEQAAGALRDPAVCAKIREFIAEEGGITPLVELLKSDNIKVVRHAAGALANMSMNINKKTV